MNLLRVILGREDGLAKDKEDPFNRHVRRPFSIVASTCTTTTSSVPSGTRWTSLSIIILIVHMFAFWHTECVGGATEVPHSKYVAKTLFCWCIKEYIPTKKDAMKKYATKKDVMKRYARHQSVKRIIREHIFVCRNSQNGHQFYSFILTESPTSRFFSSPVRGMKVEVSLIFQNLLTIFFFQVSKSKINQLFDYAERTKD